MEEIASFDTRHPPHLVLTGGDPLERVDLFELIDRGRDLGLRVSITPSGTPKLTPETIGRFEEAGISAVALSIDGPSPDVHDSLRGVQGSFHRTVQAAQAVGGTELDLYVHTLVTEQTIDAIPRVNALTELLGAHGWSLFFLIQTGRGIQLDGPPPSKVHELFEWLWERIQQGEIPEVLRTTEAPHFRAWGRRRAREAGKDPRTFHGTPLADGLGVRDGNGIVFVSHKGEIHPSGFLPLRCGNVRDRSLVETYRDHETFRALRDPDRFEGRCGRCPARSVCGGSRARAHAEAGDALASDPLCQLPIPEQTGRATHP